MLLCLIGGTMIWMLNALNKNYTAVIKCAVRYEFGSKNLVIVNPPPDKIDLNVSAGGWKLLRRTLLRTHTPALLKLNNPVGTHYILGSTLAPILTEQLVDLHINHIMTDTLYYDIQNRKQKMLIGKVDRHRINLLENFRIVGPINIDPGEFTVTGPEKLIDALPEYFEITIDRTEINKPFNREVKPDLFNSDLVHFDPDKIRVSFNVERFTDQALEIPVVPINFPRDSSVYIARPWIKVKFKVRESMQDSVRSGQFIISANYRTMKKKDSMVALQVESIPSFIEDFRPDSTFIRVAYGKTRKPS